MESWRFCCLLSVAVLLTAGKDSSDLFNTLEGCNATLICNQIEGIKWINASSTNEIQGPRFTKTIFTSFMILTINDVSRADDGNYTCVTTGRNRTIRLEVCFDAFSTNSCLNIIQGGDDCTHPWMVGNCKKSCQLCAEPNCTVAVLPTLPSSTSRSLTDLQRTTLPTAATERDAGSHGTESGAALNAGLHKRVFVLSILFLLNELMVNS